jgi:hypothetical protein
MDKIIGEIIKETPNDMELGAKIRELYPQITKEEVLSKEYLEHWTCDHCGKNTHEVEYDYLGNGTNHLQCDLIAEDTDKEVHEHSMGAGFAQKDVKHFADGFHEGNWEKD